MQSELHFGVEPARQSSPNIVLVNPISGRGHLDAYARLYARALTELGCRVVLVAAKDGGTVDYLARQTPGIAKRFSFISIDAGLAWRPTEPKPVEMRQSVIEVACGGVAAPSGAIKRPLNEAAASEDLSGKVVSSQRCRLGTIQRARLVWQEEGPTGVLMRCAAVPARIFRPIFVVFRRSADGAVNISRRVVRVFVNALLIGLGPPSMLYGVVRSSVLRPARFVVMQLPVMRQLVRDHLARAKVPYIDADRGRIRFEHLVRAVLGAVHSSGGFLPDLVIFLYLDMMAMEWVNVTVLDRPDFWPWAGILFHPRLAREPEAKIEGYFRSVHARGGIFLVPPAIAAYRRAAPHLHFALAPDVADLELAAEEPAIATEIRRRACGRKVVLVIGSIVPHKGILTTLAVIANADPTRFFFAIVGEAHWESFGTDEKFLRAFCADPPENVLVHEGYIDDERDYNSVVSACDILYAVYRDFNSSSNALTKAAGLRIPILVAAATLMGQRVLASGIGGVAPEGDAAGILASLERLSQCQRTSFAFDSYLDRHSLDCLKNVLRQALPHWTGTTHMAASPAVSS